MSGFTAVNNVSVLPSPLQNAHSIRCHAEPALPLPEPSNLMSFHWKALSSLGLLQKLKAGPKLSTHNGFSLCLSHLESVTFTDEDV